jgi:hypothetical protein
LLSFAFDRPDAWTLLFVSAVFWLAIAPAWSEEKTWTGAASTDWFNADNWSPAGVPQGEDTVVVSSGNVNVQTPASVSVLRLNGGTLAGISTLTVTNMQWTGGQMTGTGVTCIARSGQLVISGSSLKGFQGRTIENLGTTIWTNTGIILAGAGAVFCNQGNFELHNDVGFNTAPWAYVRFINYGRLAKVHGTLVSTIGGYFTNLGTVEIHGGALLVSRYNQLGGSTKLMGGRLSSGRPIEIQAGTLRGCGDIDVEVVCRGVLEPGNPFGLLRIRDTLIQHGPIRFRVGHSADTNQYSRLEVGSQSQILGDLSLLPEEGYMPKAGDVFEVLKSATRLGGFLSLPPLDFASGLRLLSSFDGFSLVLAASSPPAQPVVLSLAPRPEPHPRVRFAGERGRGYVLQASADLTHWLDLTETNLTDGGAVELMDSDAPLHDLRFYRLRSQP